MSSRKKKAKLSNNSESVPQPSKTRSQHSERAHSSSQHSARAHSSSQNSARAHSSSQHSARPHTSSQNTEKPDTTSQNSEKPKITFQQTLARARALVAQERKNFDTACKLVSYRDYSDHCVQFMLVNLPACMNLLCKHHNVNTDQIEEISPYAYESIMIDVKRYVWYDALATCSLCITETQYLSADVLKEIIDIILNAHGDEQYQIKHVIDRCIQVLKKQFTLHPPCFLHNLRNCYINFLISPMSPKEKSYTNRAEFDCCKGIVKYCMNRLEHELSHDCIDGPLYDKDAYIPDPKRNNLRNFIWQKQTFETLEFLKREDRIDRLFAVIEIVLELLQNDIAIWHSRYTRNMGCHILRFQKPLMAYVLWSDNLEEVGEFTVNYRQMYRIFAHLVHLQYPEHMVKTFVIWINTVIQTVYTCQEDSNVDFPATDENCITFANDFYGVISSLPLESIIKIIELIKPTYMRHIIGLIHLNKILSMEEGNVMRMLINIMSKQLWRAYPAYNTELIIFGRTMYLPQNDTDNITPMEIPSSSETTQRHYPRIDRGFRITDEQASLNHIVHCLYVTLDACLNAFNVKSVLETWNNLNHQTLDESRATEVDTETVLTENNNYFVTDSLIRKYRKILKSLHEFKELYANLRARGKLPIIFNVFENIEFIE